MRRFSLAVIVLVALVALPLTAEPPRRDRAVQEPGAQSSGLARGFSGFARTATCSFRRCRSRRRVPSHHPSSTLPGADTPGKLISYDEMGPAGSRLLDGQVEKPSQALSSY